MRARVGDDVLQTLLLASSYARLALAGCSIRVAQRADQRQPMRRFSYEAHGGIPLGFAATSASRRLTLAPLTLLAGFPWGGAGVEGPGVGQVACAPL